MTEIKGIKDFYNAVAAQFADEWYGNESLLPVLRRFISLLGPSPAVLDLGCGAGYESMRLKRLGANVTGVDYAEEAVKIAREKNPDCRFELMDFRELDHSLGLFDGIVALASLIHIAEHELEPVFNGMRKVLKDNGYLMLIVIEGEGISDKFSIIEKSGIKYNRTFYLHSLELLNKVAAGTGFVFDHESEMPEEHRTYGWKCFIFRAI